MGIKQFGVFLLKKAPHVFQRTSMEDFAGKRLGIDMHQVLYQLFFRNAADETATVEDLRRCMARTVQRVGARPLFVFDGNTRGLKAAAHEQRKRVREDGLRALEDLTVQVDALVKASEAVASPSCDVVVDTGGSVAASPTPPASPTSPRKKQHLKLEEVDGSGSGSGSAPAPAPTPTPLVECMIVALQARIDKKQRQLTCPTGALFREARRALGDIFGSHSVVTAADDAERHIAVLCSRGDIDFAVSEDYDTLFFGSPNLVRHFLDDSKMVVLQRAAVQAALGLPSYEHLVDFGILCGCDVCDKVKGIGPVKALALVQKYGSIDAMFARELKPRLDAEDPPVDFNYTFARARLTDRDNVPVPVLETAHEIPA